MHEMEGENSFGKMKEEKEGLPTELTTCPVFQSSGHI